MQLEGIHHITAITGDAPAQRRFLRSRPRHAARQEDGQPGRSERLPPVLRRRAGQRRCRPHVLRVPGRDPGAAGPGMVHRILTRVASPEALDFWAERLGGEGVADGARRRQPQLRRPRGHGARARRGRPARRAARRAPSRDPARARAAGLRGGARLQHAARLDEARARGRPQLHLRRRLGVGGARRVARRPLRARPAARGPRRSRRGHRPPRRLRLDLRGSRGLGRARARRSASTRRR